MSYAVANELFVYFVLVCCGFLAAVIVDRVLTEKDSKKKVDEDSEYANINLNENNGDVSMGKKEFDVEKSQRKMQIIFQLFRAVIGVLALCAIISLLYALEILH